MTKKHLAAWEDFRRSKFSFVIVMEADATWADPQSNKLIQTLGLLSTKTPLYISIAGGIPMSSLKIEKLVTKRNIEGNQEILTLSKPVTNKACAYIINRPLVELLLDAVSDPANEAVRSLAIDWLTNALFMQIGGLGSQITCQLFDPPLLIQGSMLSTYESWHPDRTYRP